MAGVNVGKVKGKELAPGERPHHRRDRDRPPLRPDQARRARDAAPEEPAGGDLRGDRARAAATRPTSPTAARCRVTTWPADRRARRDLQRLRRAHPAQLPGLAARVGHRHLGHLREDFNDALGNAAPFFAERRQASCARSTEQDVAAAARSCATPDACSTAVLGEDGHSLRDLIEGGEATFSALASRDDALAETFEVLPTFLRETRTTVERLERVRPRHRPARPRPARARPTTSAPTLRDLGRPVARPRAPVPRRRAARRPPPQPACRPPSACSRASSRCSSRLTSFLPELNPILAYLSFSREQVATFLAPGRLRARRQRDRAATASSRFAEHYLPQSAIIDSRSLQRRAARPFWERANSYVAPNAWERSIGLGAIEAFDCGPAGGEVRNPSGSGATLGAALLRGAAAALPGPALPAPAPRAGAARGCRRRVAPETRRPGPRATRPRGAPAPRAVRRWRRGRCAPPRGPGGHRRPEARRRSAATRCSSPPSRASAARSTPCGVAMWRS